MCGTNLEAWLDRMWSNCEASREYELIASIERSFSDLERMNAGIKPVVERYLPFLMNCRLAGLGSITLNLRRCEYADAYDYCRDNGWSTILGMEINWT